ncbi:MAG: beta-lactamase family protein [Firmicutes bacterium]|nr:beta-lactamase family protein [Bacillota bacterium]
MERNGEITVIEKETGVTPESVGYLSSTIQKLDDHLKKLVAEDKLQCAGYLLARHGKTFALRSMGPLRYSEDRPFLPNSIRRIASITKVFVAVAIMQLVEEGLLRLDQPVAEIIPEFNKPGLNAITIFHLLTHTSGLRPDPGAFFEPYPEDYSWFRKKNWIKSALSGPQAVEPGKEWRYSSTCFTILGEIVTRVSGIHFETYVIENIARPLQMTETFFDVPDDLEERVCFANKWEHQWYQKGKEKPRPKWAAPRAGGGLFSTMENLARLGQMLLNKGTLDGKRVLARKTVESMTRNHLHGVKNYCWGAGGTEMEYGLGFNVYSNNTFLSPGSFSHEGAGLCGLYVDPVEELVFVYICPLNEKYGWLPEAVINLRNIAWSGLI